MTAFYNEIDPNAAAWLRELIRAGLIAPGVVDERSIEDLSPHDVSGFSQVHLFAGIGVWSYALRQSGWPDDRSVWTASCPCQPFSSAGAQAGFDDERHLWPHLQYLVEQCRPAVIFGEQVASKAAEPWFDLVQTDLEAMGYAFGCVPFPSAGVGAPHIRDRAYWVGHANNPRLERHPRHGGTAGRQGPSGSVAEAGVSGGLADLHSNRRDQARGCEPATGPTTGFWRDADWLFCRDGRWRPVESGTFPLVDGAPARVVRLRGYGNAINAEAARTFIEVAMEYKSWK